MADVKVCDRCCKVLGHTRALIGLKPVKRNALMIEIFKKDKYVSGEYRKACTNHDLCEDCTNKLVEFLEGKAVEAVRRTTNAD